MIVPIPDSTRWMGISRRRLAVATALMGLAQPAAAQDALVLRSRSLTVDYAVNPEARPITDVTIWLTDDRGASWRMHGRDIDLRSPARIKVPEDGLYGLFIVVSNAIGASSQPPAEATRPHRWLFVDATSPVVQLRRLEQADSEGLPVVRIRWAAVDAFLPDRPIELQYQVDGQSEWRRITAEPLPNTGRFDWQVPESASSVAVRVIAQDRGGNRATSEPRSLTLAASRRVPVEPTAPYHSITANGHPGRVQAPRPSTDRWRSQEPSQRSSPAARASARPLAGAERVDALISEARTLRDEGALARGVARLREAVELAPERTDAFAELGGMLYRLGDHEHALGAYDIVLRRDPDSRVALLGSAAVLSHQRDYSSAVRRLRTLLRYHPTDAEAWMNLGDLAVFQGDEALARECYTRATQIDETATAVIADARKRLALMNQVSRSHRTGE